MILVALLAMQVTPPPPPPRIDFESVSRIPPLVVSGNSMRCARWNERHRKDRTARVADMAWLQGFLDGERADSRVSEAVALGSMDTRCERNPDALVIDIARAVLSSLRTERR